MKVLDIGSGSGYLTHVLANIVCGCDGKGEGKVVGVEQRLRHPHSRLKVHLAWDISFWVAVVFTIGSAAWVSNLPFRTVSSK